MAKQYTINISLTRDLDEFVKAKVKTGGYASVSEVMRELLRNAQRSDRQRASEIRSMRRKIDAGLRQARRGELIDGPAAMARQRQRLIQMAAAQGQQRRAS